MKTNKKLVAWCIIDRDSADGSITLFSDEVYDTRKRAREALASWKRDFDYYGGTLSVGKLTNEG